MSDERPKVPRPAAYQKFDRDFARASHDSSLPPAAKKAITERDVKVTSDTAAMAHAITSYQLATNRRHDQLVAQVAAMHAHIITMDAFARRSAWARSPVFRLLATAFGAAAGVYAASKGFTP